MDFLRQTDVIQWNDGKYETIKENSVDDEYTYLFIDYLPPRKFSTYPKDLEDFAIGYCLGEGLIKDYNDIESIKLDGTNVLVSTKLSMIQKKIWNKKELSKRKKEIVNMLVCVDCLNIKE